MSKKKSFYEPCPLSRWPNGKCIFASVYYGVTRCFYGCGETIIEKRNVQTGELIEQPNMECPRQVMYRESSKRKKEAMAIRDALALLEGEEGTKFG